LERALLHRGLVVGRAALATPCAALPGRAGILAGSVFFAGFAWLELVYPRPDDPERLAYAVGAYWLVAFRRHDPVRRGGWTERAEPFSIFFA
jgi:hypothetical protein